ncbi:MAG: diguanylate cyclase [Thermoleophilaceae bacterium]
MAGKDDETQTSLEGVIDDVRSVIDHAHEAFIAMDAGGFVIDWNPQAQRTFGEEAVGQVLADLIIPPRYRDAHWVGLRHYLDTGEGPLLGKRLELSAIDRSGREFPIELTITRQPSSSALRFSAFLHDISERRLSERLLRAQHAITSVFAGAQSTREAMSGVLAGLGEAMGWQLGAWWSYEDGAQVLNCCEVWRSDPTLAPEFEQVSLGLELAPGVGLPGRVWASGKPAWTADIAADPSLPRSQAAARTGLHASLCAPIFCNHKFRGAIEFFSVQTGAPDRATREIIATIATQMGRFIGLLDEHSGLIAKLERLALTDELTDLPNRRAWQQGLERELALAQRHGRPLCIAMLDLDHFKRYNDTNGHQAGDGLLREIAQTWRAQLRSSDILARYGGEEFSLLLSSWPIEMAETALERVRAATPQGQTCSAGLAAFDGSESGEELVSRADAALYEAKAGGRDRSVVAKPGVP